MRYPSSSVSSSMTNSTKSVSSCSSPSSPPPPSLVALPSMTHSLAALPTMSSIPRDMLHYGNTGAHSKAKLDSALQKKQTQPLPAHAHLTQNVSNDSESETA
ncbi:hypothetical protein SERLADRAFT_469188 [Serpula lacrymans var. lacrymans S7.9]|uniref:Uncharacterized protein n=1 Tax=Serpula lacrymans var. lacrymans (strain S7.9) TaxID=578457 RepID=F8NZM5_SERL9|nr:uncharacterized protein SERLADRAFT_469188 [Serpula lacrymans var. lacrymans S7.9]EGO23356.1 hypothetical protein SERLADRAFT_469188 [Serpula lacrymans var. lacrymans S7.9]